MLITIEDAPNHHKGLTPVFGFAFSAHRLFHHCVSIEPSPEAVHGHIIGGGTQSLEVVAGTFLILADQQVAA
jgi:hypothetical protein